MHTPGILGCHEGLSRDLPELMALSDLVAAFGLTESHFSEGAAKQQQASAQHQMKFQAVVQDKSSALSRGRGCKAHAQPAWDCLEVLEVRATVHLPRAGHRAEMRQTQ